MGRGGGLGHHAPRVLTQLLLARPAELLLLLPVGPKEDEGWNGVDSVLALQLAVELGVDLHKNSLALVLLGTKKRRNCRREARLLRGGEARTLVDHFSCTLASFL